MNSDSVLELLELLGELSWLVETDSVREELSGEGAGQRCVERD